MKSHSFTPSVNLTRFLIHMSYACKHRQFRFPCSLRGALGAPCLCSVMLGLTATSDGPQRGNRVWLWSAAAQSRRRFNDKSALSSAFNCFLSTEIWSASNLRLEKQETHFYRISYCSKFTPKSFPVCLHEQCSRSGQDQGVMSCKSQAAPQFFFSTSTHFCHFKQGRHTQWICSVVK